jgi:hypothetical protein
MYGQRNFMIIDVAELGSVDFSQVLETSADTVRKSVDGTKTFVKWDGDIVPPSVDALAFKLGPLSYEEITPILASEEWTKPINLDQLSGGTI